MIRETMIRERFERERAREGSTSLLKSRKTSRKEKTWEMRECASSSVIPNIKQKTLNCCQLMTVCFLERMENISSPYRWLLISECEELADICIRGKKFVTGRELTETLSIDCFRWRKRGRSEDRSSESRSFLDLQHLICFGI